MAPKAYDTNFTLFFPYPEFNQIIGNLNILFSLFRPTVPLGIAIAMTQQYICRRLFLHKNEDKDKEKSKLALDNRWYIRCGTVTQNGSIPQNLVRTLCIYKIAIAQVYIKRQAHMLHTKAHIQTVSIAIKFY